MTPARMWLRLRNFLRWKKATTPMLLNDDTGELIPFSTYTVPPSGKWKLRRPLALPGSTRPLFLEVRGIPGGIRVRKRPEASNQPRHPVGGQNNMGASPPQPPQQSI